MERKIKTLSVAFILLIAATGVLFVSVQKGNSDIQAIFLQNIEALTQEEETPIDMKFCFKAGSLGGDKPQCSQDTHVSTQPGIPTGPIYKCSGTITPSFLTRVGYCYK